MNLIKKIFNKAIKFLNAPSKLNLIKRHFFKNIANVSVINNIVAEKRMKKLLIWPVGISFMGTNLCNALCTFCIYRMKDNPKLIKLDMELFKSYVNAMEQHGKPFQVGMTPSYAEPLTDPEFKARFNFLREKKNINYLHFTTNLISMQRFGVDALINSGADAIHISIGGMDRESYKKLYKVDKYNIVFKNLIELIEKNSILKRVHIDVIVRTNETERAIEVKPDYIKLKKYSQEGKCSLTIENLFDDWGGEIILDEFNLKRAKPLKVKSRACALIYLGPSIMPSGNVVLCSCKDTAGTPLEVPHSCRGDINNIVLYRKRIVNEWENLGEIPEVCRRCNTYSDPHIFYGLNGDKHAINSIEK